MRGPAVFTALGRLFGATLVGLLVLPIIALFLSTSLDDVLAGTSHPLFIPALGLSLRTTLLSLLFTVLLGTPLAWWLAASKSRLAEGIAVVIELPIILPPAVVGIALLQTFGRLGVLGSSLEALGLQVVFSETAVILAQIVVASPFFVQAATNAFRKVDLDMLIVARTLGASPAAAFFRVALPIALPGLITGASLAWARALGEFGATLLFAGNLTGTTQTLPLAIFSAMESDVRLAVVFAVVLAAIGVVLLGALRFIPALRNTKPVVST